ncbi:MAG: hypothetical protein GY757_60645 [bacterium]|nr:hypothetical protein [bacterium]
MSFAQQLRDEGKEIGVEQERQKFEKERQKTARELVTQGVNLDIVAGATGIPVEDLKKML